MKRRRFLTTLGAAAGGACALGCGPRAAGGLRPARRREFLLPDGYAYFNTGGLGASPSVVIDTVKEKMDLEDTYPAAGHNLDDWEAIKDKCAVHFGPGCRSAELALTSTTSEGINIILNGLPLEAGDEVILSTHEHAALAIPLLHMMRTRGIRLRTFVPDMERGLGNVERVDALISTRTRLIFISHVTCTTGQIFPVAEIGALARKHGIWFALDGVQALAAIAVDVRQIGVDFYAVSGHKWLLGPRRTGILYVREEMLETLVPTVVGTYSDTSSSLKERTLELQPTAQRYEFGTQNDALFYGLGAAADFITDLGPDKIRRHNHCLTGRLLDGLGRIPQVTILSPMAAEYRSSMVTFRLRGHDYRDVCARLLKRRLRVRAVGEADLDGVRVSCHLYNSEDEVVRLLDEVTAIAQGNRHEDS